MISMMSLISLIISSFPKKHLMISMISLVGSMGAVSSEKTQTNSKDNTKIEEENNEKQIPNRPRGQTSLDSFMHIDA